MPNTRRYFAPGSKWLYFKIYTGSKTADKILTNELYQITEELKRKDLISKWFFIRYGDPRFHLRLRFLLTKQEYSGNVIALVHRKFFRLINEHIISKIQLDTYNRELERYHPQLINEAETFFYYDSEYTINILRQINKDSDRNLRWIVAIKLIDTLLADFSFDTRRKQELTNNISQAFKKEFGFNEHNAKQFNHKYRENKKIIEALLSNDTTIIPQHILSMIEAKSKTSMSVIKQIKRKVRQENITLEYLLSSYIHMMLNRLFISRNRQYELILYDFLYRYYTSEIAKEKYAKK